MSKTNSKTKQRVRRSQARAAVRVHPLVQRQRYGTIHAYTLSTLAPDRLNAKLCGETRGSPYVTGHIHGMTCGRCLRIIHNSTKLSAAYSP